MNYIEPLLYVSKPKYEIKSNIIKNDFDNLINQLDELFNLNKKVLCEVKLKEKFLTGYIKKVNEYEINIDDELIKKSDILDINVLKI